MRWIIFCLAIFTLTGCLHQPPSRPGELSVSYLQVGNEIYLSGALLTSLKIRGAGEIKRFPSVLVVRPKKRCLELVSNQKATKICLREIPPISPRLWLLKKDSGEIELQVVSLFKKFVLLRWEEGGSPNPFRAQITGPIIKDTAVLPNKTYFYSVAIFFDDHTFGPLSPPLRISTLDQTPPQPPPGGGYLLEKDALTLIWEESPSKDVAYYRIEKRGESFKAQKAPFVDREWHGERIYKISAVDKAGNISRPLIIEIKEVGP